MVTVLVSCTENKAEKVAIDSLVNNADQYANKAIEVEGMAVHYCGANNKKLKLKSENGAVLKVVPANLLVPFHNKFNHKKLRIVGRIETKKVEKAFVDQIECDKTLLCHIDHTPCTDEDWVKRKKEQGVADSLSAADVKKLRDEMERTGKNYVTVVTLFANDITIMEE